MKTERLKIAAILLIAVVLAVMGAERPVAWSAPQVSQDLRKKAERKIAGLPKSQLGFEGNEGPDKGDHEDIGALLHRESFKHLSATGQMAVRWRHDHGRLWGLAGEHRERGLFGQNLRVNDPRLDQFAHTQSTSSIAVRGRNVIVAFNDFDVTDSSSAYAFSTDNGRTFTQRRLTPPEPGGFTFGEPVVAYGPSGELYCSTLAQGSAGSLIGVAKSTDNGATFSLPVDASTTAVNFVDFQDKPWLAVDTNSHSSFRGNVYVSWSDFTGSGAVFINFARSTDGGQTFSQPVPLTSPDGSGVQGSMPAVAPNGDIYVAYEDSSAGGVAVVKSTDGGESFSAPVTAARFLSLNALTGGSFVRTNGWPSMAVDRHGAVHIVFGATPRLSGLDRADVFYVRSEDGGQTFTSSLRLNDDHTNTSQWSPSIATTQEGEIGVKWWDRRNDPVHDGLTDVYMTISHDGGRTFSSNFRVTDHNWVFGPVERFPDSGYHGDYDDVAGGLDRFLLSWSDERGDDPDVFFSDQRADQDGKAPDFNISANMLFDSVIAGGATQYPLATRGFHGFSRNLHLSADPSITGISYRFSPRSVDPGERSELIVDTDTSTPPGTYLITVTAVGGDLTRRTNLRLTVFPPSRTAGVPRNVTDTPGFTSIDSGLQIDSRGTLHLLYEDDTQVPNVGAQVFYKQSRDGGATFTRPLLISTNSDISFNASLVAGAGGKLYAVWTEFAPDFSTAQIFLSRSTDGGGTFSKPVPVSPLAEDDELAKIAVDKNGNLMITYRNFSFANFPVVFIRSTDGGATFSVPVAISEASDTASNDPAYVAFDSLGAAYVVYDSRDDGSSTPDQVRLAIAPDGVNFTVRKILSNLSFEPHLAVDSHDNVFIAFTNFFFHIGSGVDFANFETVLIKSGDHGTTFEPPLDVSNSFPDKASTPFVIADSAGNITVAWEDTKDNDQSEVFVARSTDGGASFSTPFNLSGNSGLSTGPCGAANAAGRVFVGWTDDSPANPDVFVAHTGP